MAEIAFHIAGLEVLLRAGDERVLEGLPFGLDATDAPVAPGLVIDFDRDASLGPPYAPDHPRFSRRRDGDRLLVERADCAGWIALSGAVVHARFRVPDDLYAREACLRVALSIALPRHDAVILHASAVRSEGRAHVFTGISGTGKSTIAALLDALPGYQRLADELLVLARGADGWSVHVPPFLGVAGLPIGERAPLASIELLAQAPSHRRTALAPLAAIRELLRHVVVYAAEPATADRVLAITERLVADVPCHRLEFRNDPSVAGVLAVA